MIMKKIAILFIIILTSSLSFAQDIDKEKQSIKDVIQTAYVEGLQNEGDIKKIDSGIHPDFKLIGISPNDKMWELPIKEWKEKTLKRKKEGKLPREKDNLISVKFLSIDITGTAAVAKIEFYVVDELKYIDYISLYKFDTGWKMVNKIFYKFPKNK